jgi:hypothetical protein
VLTSGREHSAVCAAVYLSNFTLAGHLETNIGTEHIFGQHLWIVIFYVLNKIFGLRGWWHGVAEYAIKWTGSSLPFRLPCALAEGRRETLKRFQAEEKKENNNKTG